MSLLVILRRSFDGVVVQTPVLGAELVQLLGVPQTVGREIRVQVGEHDVHGGKSGGRFPGQIGSYTRATEHNAQWSVSGPSITRRVQRAGSWSSDMRTTWGRVADADYRSKNKLSCVPTVIGQRLKSIVVSIAH